VNKSNDVDTDGYYVETRLQPLSLNEYQERALTTAQYPEQGTSSPLALAYVGLGLGEAGEIQGKIKKILRDHDLEAIRLDGLPLEARLAILQEYGDLLWYIAVGVAELGMDLDTVAMMNLDKLTSRKERGVIKGSGDER